MHSSVLSVGWYGKLSFMTDYCEVWFGSIGLQISPILDWISVGKRRKKVCTYASPSAIEENSNMILTAMIRQGGMFGT